MEFTDSAEMKEAFKDNPNMLLWLAATEWALRVNESELPGPGVHPGPTSDINAEGNWVVAMPDEQYYDDVAEAAKLIDKYKHVPPDERYKKKK